MKFGLMTVGVLMGLNAFSATDSQDYFKIGKVTTTQIVLDAAQEAALFPSTMDKTFENQCDEGNINEGKEKGRGSLTETTPADDLDSVEVIVDKIINIGKKIWGIIAMGKPVYNSKLDVAHALPMGIKCWTHLEGWKAPQSNIWKVSYENQMGNKVVEFIYRVSFIPGGQYKGIGHYITQATISPAKVYVGWGFELNVEGSTPSIFNMGSHENPVAAMELKVKWKVDSIMVHHEVEDQFYVNGLGEFQKMQFDQIKKH